MPRVATLRTLRGANRAALRARLVEQNVWIRPFRDIIYLTPALTIAPADLTHLTTAIKTVLTSP